MANRGKIMYVPHILIEEMDDLRMEHKIDHKVEAFNKLADYARVGREAERLAKFKFDWPVTKRKR